MIEKIRDGLYIKKGWDGYRVVYPIKLDPSKPYSWDNINWKTFFFGGHWSYALKLLLGLIALYFFVKMYLHDTQVCREYVQNIGQVCAEYSRYILGNTQSNVSNFSFRGLR